MSKYSFFDTIVLPAIRVDDNIIMCSGYNAVAAVAVVAKDYATMLQAMPHLANLDFSALKEPRYQNAEQKAIQQERINAMAA